MTEKELVAKMIGTLAKGRKEIDNSDYKITIEALPELDEIIEHLSSPLMIMVMGEFSTGKSTFINALVGEEIAAVNATPTTAVITKLCYGEQDKILVHFTDGTEKEVESNTFKQLTSKTGKVDEDNVHESIEYVERQMPLDMLQYVTIIDSPGLNDVNEKHSATTKKFVSNADSVLWMFSSLQAGSKTEVDAMESLTPRLKPIAIVNKMDEFDEEEDDPQEFLDNLRVQLKDKVQAVVGISAKHALEGKLEKNETKIEIGNLKEVEQVVRELVLPNRDKFKLNTLMDELGGYFCGVLSDLRDEEDTIQRLKDDDYLQYLNIKEKIQNTEEILFSIANEMKDYCLTEVKKYNEQAMFFIAILYYFGICFSKDDEKAETFLEKAALKKHSVAQGVLGYFYIVKEDVKKAFIWYKRSAEQGLDSSQYVLGNWYLNGVGVEVDEEQALEWFKKAAEQGHVEAQNMLGRCYEEGWGTVKDEEEAFQWFKKAAEQGNATAQCNLADYYRKGVFVKKDYKKSFKWFDKAAKQGNATGQSVLGVYYEYGLGVEKDENQAFKWYKKAAEQGDANGQYSIGKLFENGIGTRENPIQAFQWYKKAAEQGDERAQCRLGYCYSAGYGIETDMEKAFCWYEKAAKQDEPEAQYCVACCYYNGMGVVKDERKAFEWYEKAAYNNHREAQGALAACYSEGIGTEKNYVKAFEWYKHTAENGDATGQHKVAIGYFKGIGVKKDEEKAVTWLIKSAKQGNVNAQIDLGFCYINGRGTLIDSEKALYWYKKAAEQGDENAQKRVIELEKQNQTIDRNKANVINTNKQDSKENATISNVPKVMARRHKVENEEACFARYKKEAELGNQKSQYELAVCYEIGKGTTKSEQLAVYWCQKSAEQGYQLAQYRLANYYLKGFGVAYDENQAIGWLEKAANQGNKSAEWQLESIKKKKEDEEDKDTKKWFDNLLRQQGYNI